MAMFDQNNLFAKIIRGELPSKLVYEDEFTFSIYDINPIPKIHVLAICKGNFITFDELIQNGKEAQILGFMRGINNTIEKLGIMQSGYRLVTNARKDGRQEIEHLHVHILGGEELAIPEKSN